MKGTVLIVDDDEALRRSLSRWLQREEYQVETADSGGAGLASLAARPIDLVLLDLHLPDRDGLDVLSAMRAGSYNQPVVMMSGQGTVEAAATAVKLGALDFVTKPLVLQKVLVTIQNALRLEKLALVQTDLQTELSCQLLGESAAMRDLRALIAKAAPTDARILITGENGTGKELVARAICAASGRRSQALVKLNCAAVPADLMESELFGHEKGAFTGAISMRRGKFELADGGTLFLDEVGEIPLAMQPKLLRVLQEGEIERVGGSKTIPVDTRVIAATNRDLQKMVRSGSFREDLFYRLDVFRIETPPLRRRPEDIPQLVQHFLGRAGRKAGRPDLRLEPAALALLGQHDFPGNVRELENLIERLAILAEGEIVGCAAILAVLPKGDAAQPKRAGSTPPSLYLPGVPLKEQMRRLERQVIQEALRQHADHVAAAARDLGLERSHLHKKIKALEIRSASQEAEAEVVCADKQPA